MAFPIAASIFVPLCPVRADAASAFIEEGEVDDDGVPSLAASPDNAEDPSLNQKIDPPLAAGDDPSALPTTFKAEYKRLDEMWDSRRGFYILVESAPLPVPPPDMYEEYCFTVIRRVNWETGLAEFTQIELKSRWLKKACGAAIGDADRISWGSSKPARVSPDLLIRYMPFLTKMAAKLCDDDIEKSKLSQLDLLVDFIRDEYASTFEDLRELTSRNEITFDLLGCILLPGTVLFYTCAVTGEPRAARLMSHVYSPASGYSPASWNITAAYVEALGTRTDSAPHFGPAQVDFEIKDFKGERKIYTLHVHPFEFNPRREELRKRLVERGKKWQALDGLHHVRYDGTASMGRRRLLINSRIMVDVVLYREMTGSFSLPNIIRPEEYGDYSDSDDEFEFEDSTDEAPDLDELSDDALLLASPILYGFSLTDKCWLEFNVVHVTDIKWNDEAFASLVLPRAQKDLIKGLVEAQAAQSFEFDDFIEGKGRGLVVNLFGPPGVGKTMSAEAVSEHLRRPLYMVAAGELATTPRELERDLSDMFKIGSKWGSVTLLDEADVFLEQRSLHDLQRNALVAIFLRQLEYFPGLLFVTTNRVRAFDHAFQSRIHVSLRFRELSEDARREVWRAFLAKLANFDGPLSAEEEDSLVKRHFNGRQIKNAVRTSGALAASRGEKVSYAILCDVVDIMEQFEADFSELQESGTV